MSLFDVFAVLITVTAVVGFANSRWLRLPTTIGVLAGGMLISLALILVTRVAHVGTEWGAELMQRIDFDDLLMNGLLSFLLFAGALHVELDHLARQKWTIALLATFGTVLSAFIIGTVLWVLLPAMVGFEIPFVVALLFGSLISPTDPVAVLSLLRDTNAPPELETLVTGESLFNDGVGVVLFTLVASAVFHTGDVGASHVALLFLEEAVGGVVFGVALGYLAYQLLRRVDDYTVEILITLAVVTGGYSLAGAIHVSGPLAMVAAGLLIGNHGRRFGMSQRTREHLDTFWTVTDEAMNAVLFVLIGLEMVVLDFEPAYIVAGLLAIGVSLLARLIAVGVPLSIVRVAKSLRPYTIRIMTWGGLRGGIAVALALSIPALPERDLLLAMTYAVVVFSILVQGLTVDRLAKRALSGEAA